MIARVPEEYLRKLVNSGFNGISAEQRDEMAIPSYLHGNPLIRWLMWKRYEVIADMASLDKDCTVLEFGCGMGVFLPTLCRLAGTVWAIDLVPDFAKRLAEDMELRVSFADDLSHVPDGSLDAIVAADVLEHVDNLEGFARAFVQKLKPGGRLIVSGPTESIVYKIGRIFAGFGDKGDYHHRNIHDICALLASTGLKQTRARNLPFAVMPALFRVAGFEASPE